MSRTGEIVLTIIGVLCYVFTALMGFVTVWMMSSDNFVEFLFGENVEVDGIYMNDIDQFLSAVGAGGWYLVIVSVIAIVVGVISIFMVKGNKNPKAAGIILIIIAVLVLVVSIGVGVFGSIFYLIAGIMCLVRKPAEPS
ncbi:DUF4064 domain-containing protein [Ornithinibacillus halophilus]|uniref:DUF4064 domain-containing protein n=1 Tax=Ornithinibacillus halophilus TaxID=930117 RepID=A0A1M5KWZ6_9BACI|nr:DUF4064 domain-containing protein [Ornithinibacillus halophilus]SHG57267.1 Protein of unknown function [Ornithinibacillus halophilus]